MRTLKLIVGVSLLMAATACAYYDDTGYRYRYSRVQYYAYEQPHYYVYDQPYYYSYEFYRPTP